MKPTADSGLIKRTNSRRLRRDTKDAVEQPRVKRQGLYSDTIGIDKIEHL